MGLTNNSTGIKALDTELCFKKTNKNEKIIAIAGNPNVGKSTLFNSLTGMRQHTGNWPGKTVTNAHGYCKTESENYVLVDIPGTYSLFAHSPEEEIARNFLCFGNPDKVVVVCDATCMERSLNLVLQTLEITKNVIVCVNLLDEAKKKGIKINLELLSQKLGVPVVGTVARNKKSLLALLDALDQPPQKDNIDTFSVKYPLVVTQAVKTIEASLPNQIKTRINSLWLSLRLLEHDTSLIEKICEYLNYDVLKDKNITNAIEIANEFLHINEYDSRKLRYTIASALVIESEKLAKSVVTYLNKNYSLKDRKIDKILTGKLCGYPVMILLLAFVFWLTISGANYISGFLSLIFSKAEYYLGAFLKLVNSPFWLNEFLIEGVFRVPAWVISVMLPPMAIFFPLFTLLEDLGYLPRIAYNLDKPFKRCKSCGKQALTMCMGFGCNAAGIVGCRIIDSARERLVAIITNSLVPCNGRFPAIISIITMFFIWETNHLPTLFSALILTALILLAIAVTFIATRLLSDTVLKGEVSSYTLEMPPYRKPQLCQILVRSVFDRTIFVLGRSLTVAIPAGIIIWLMANITVENVSLLNYCSDALNPFARILGLDGAILIAFILGFPANEIVLPIIIMVYLSTGSLNELSALTEIREILILNGWTATTALCTILFSLFHWPCATSLLTIKKETASIKWTIVSAVFPTVIGAFLCLVVNAFSKLFV